MVQCLRIPRGWSLLVLAACGGPVFLDGADGSGDATATTAAGTEGDPSAGSSGETDASSGPPAPADGDSSDSSSSSTSSAEEHDSTDADDGDDTTGADDTTAGETGEPGDLGKCAVLTPCDADSDLPLHAIGLDCASLGDAWIDGENATAVEDLVFKAAPAVVGKRPWRTARRYGTHDDPVAKKPTWGAREGEKLLILSTGLLPPPNPGGAVILADSDVYNDVAYDGEYDSDVLPAPIVPQEGSPDPNGHVDCDGVGDCSNTLYTQWLLGGMDPNDKLWFSFDLTAPAGTDGYAFDFALFSAEYPEYVDTTYNDVFVAWQSSEDYTGNVAYRDGRPITSSALWPIPHEGECAVDDPGCVGHDPALAGTGFIADGGGSGWYRARSGVRPGETFTLAFSIFDLLDSTYDTTVLLDNFAWECMGCDPNVAGSCDVAPL